MARNSLRDRLNYHFSNVSFLYNIDFLNTRQYEIGLKHCKYLSLSLTENETSDVDAVELFKKLKMLSKLFAPNSSPNKNLKFILNHKLQEIYPNTTLNLRVVLIVSVTVTFAERSFSKQKPIKKYQRSTMSNEIFFGLSLLCIESESIRELDLKIVVRQRYSFVFIK